MLKNIQFDIWKDCGVVKGFCLNRDKGWIFVRLWLYRQFYKFYLLLHLSWMNSFSRKSSKHPNGQLLFIRVIEILSQPLLGYTTIQHLLDRISRLSTLCFQTYVAQAQALTSLSWVSSHIISDIIGTKLEWTLNYQYVAILRYILDGYISKTHHGSNHILIGFNSFS